MVRFAALGVDELGHHFSPGFPVRGCSQLPTPWSLLPNRTASDRERNISGASSPPFSKSEPTFSSLTPLKKTPNKPETQDYKKTQLLENSWNNLNRFRCGWARIQEELERVMAGVWDTNPAHPRRSEQPSWRQPGVCVTVCVCYL